jgi:hypothetical protein
MWLLMKTEAAGCAYEDAEVLARYEGFTPAPMRNGVFIQKRLTLTSADGVSDLKLSNHVSVVVHD